MGTGEWLDFQKFGLWKTGIAWWRQGRTGLLIVEHDSKMRTIQFQKGQIVAADSDDPADNLVQVFLDQELFTLENYLQVSANFGDEHSLGDSMVQFGLITSAELLLGRRAKIFQVFKRTMSLPQGRYRFDVTQPAAISSGPHLEFPRDWIRAFLDVEDKSGLLSQLDSNLDFWIQPLQPIPETLWEKSPVADFHNLALQLQNAAHFRALALASPVEEFYLLKFLWVTSLMGYFKIQLAPEMEAGHLENEDEPALHSEERLKVVVPPPQEEVQTAPGLGLHETGVGIEGNRRRWLWLTLLALSAMVVAWFVFHNPSSPSQEVPTNEIPSPALAAPTSNPGEMNSPELDAPEMPVPATSLAMDRGELVAAAALWRAQSSEWDEQFTLGIYMVCDPGNVFALWQKFPNDDRFFVLPRDFENTPCYWVCWGRYTSRMEALTARVNLPDGLREIAADAEVYPLNKIL